MLRENKLRHLVRGSRVQNGVRVGCDQVGVGARCEGGRGCFKKLHKFDQPYAGAPETVSAEHELQSHVSGVGRGSRVLGCWRAAHESAQLKKGPGQNQVYLVHCMDQNQAHCKQ